MRYIQDFQENERVIGHYLCRVKQTQVSNAGKPYLHLRLQDKSGSVDAKVWDLNGDIQPFEEGDFIKIDGMVLLYRKEFQVRVTRARRSQPGEYDPADFVPASAQDLDALYARVTDMIESVADPAVRRLLKTLLVDDKKTAKAFQTHPAAKTMHHAFLGGLMEHTLAVAEICDFLSRRYPYVNRDLLVATALLHDIGKVRELSALPQNEYTDDGQLIGHLILGLEMITSAAAAIPDFPPDTLRLIRHSILSHHGELEFGSPKVPSTVEAFILHAADNADAKIQTFAEAIAHDKTPGPWVGFHKGLNRYVRRTDAEAETAP